MGEFRGESQKHTTTPQNTAACSAHNPLKVGFFRITSRIAFVKIVSFKPKPFTFRLSQVRAGPKREKIVSHLYLKKPFNELKSMDMEQVVAGIRKALGAQCAMDL